MTWKLSEGDFCHVEIPATDLEASRRFFEGVFGWQFLDIPEWPDGKVIKTSEDGIEGSLGTLGEDRGILAYILIKGDMTEKVRQVEEHGGRIVHPVTELAGGMFRFAQVADPEGRVFGFWQES